jgi:hypothetical protein
MNFDRLKDYVDKAGKVDLGKDYKSNFENEVVKLSKLN